ncbi:MAG: MATE family efflux transporter [Enterocloster sp.]
MNQNTNQYMAEESIGKLMLRFSIPCIMSLLVSALYNIVDQIFIGRGIGFLGNGATNVVFLVTVIALSLSLLVGDGCAAYLSICQGRRDGEHAHRSVGNAVVFITASGIVLTLLYAFFRDSILWGFGATENNIGYAREYFLYLIPGIPFFMFANAMNSVIRADGSPQFAMFSTLIGCALNVVLDPVAIFVLGWGMKGAALATITGQIVSALLAVYYLFRPKSFRPKRVSFKPDAEILKHVLPLGISSFLTQVSIVVTVAVMNNVLVIYGAGSKYGADIPMTVVGIVMKVFQIVISVVVGIAAGAQPIVGYNYGAGLWRRVKLIFRTMMAAEFSVGLVSLICFGGISGRLSAYSAARTVCTMNSAVLAFRVFLGGIVLCCIQKSCSIFLQSMGKPALSMLLSLPQGLCVKRASDPGAAAIFWGDRRPVLRPGGGCNLLWGGSAVHGSGIQKIKPSGRRGSGPVRRIPGGLAVGTKDMLKFPFRHPAGPARAAAARNVRRT